MGEMSYEDAVAALDASNAASAEQPAAVEPASQTPSSPGVESGTTGSGQTPQEPDSFTELDPSQFQNAEEYKARLQADYTRKMQGISETRKQYESIGDPERAQQALQFVEALETDPDFVMTVHQQLSDALQQAGYSPAQADAAAAQQLDESLGGGDEFGADSQMARELQELKDWRAQQDLRETERMLAGQIQAQEMTIRQNNPTYTEQDMESIYERAFAFGGDLRQAEQSFAAERQRIIEAYMNQKASVPATGLPTGSGHAEVPTTDGYDPTDLDQADKAAREWVRNLGANQ